MENNKEKSKDRGGAKEIAPKPDDSRFGVEDGSVGDVIELSEITVVGASADESSADMAHGDKIDAIEEDITKELDNYFQLEEQAIDLLDDTVDKLGLHGEPVSEPVDVFKDDPVSLPYEQFESALENVIEKLYAEKIERILNEVIERVVVNDIERLKQCILKRT